LNTPGSEFHPEPFRWDQRLYTFLLNPNPGQVEQQIMQMCDAMGGLHIIFFILFYINFIIYFIHLFFFLLFNFFIILLKF